MTVDLTKLATAKRLLFSIPLKPLQGARFQPTGFPNLGAATYQTGEGQSLLVESAQSMANRLELTIWDDARHDITVGLQGLSHVRVLRQGNFLTDTILESHRLNSPYLLKNKTDSNIMNLLVQSFGGGDVGAVDRGRFANFLVQYDIGSLLHGVFLSQSELAGGRLRLPRALSSFIEAEGVRVAPSGGVKNDHVHPRKVKGDKEGRFGNIPFSRDEFTADRITLYVNLDLAQIRGYGLGDDVERLLTLLALYKLRVLLDGDLRLRTACDLMVADASITADQPSGFVLPSQDELLPDLQAAITACSSRMTVTDVSFDDNLEAERDGGENAGNTEAENEVE